MVEADVARIETTLGYPLPGEYRDFLIRHADEVRRIKESLPSRAVLWTDPEAIIRENQNARKYAEAMSIGEGERPWPDNFLVVGTNGSGDYWFIHREGSEPGVWFWQHEGHEIDRRYESFAEYLAELRRDAQNPARWQRPPG